MNLWKFLNSRIVESLLNYYDFEYEFLRMNFASTEFLDILLLRLLRTSFILLLHQTFLC